MANDREQKKVLGCSGLCCSLPLVEVRTELDKMYTGQTCARLFNKADCTIKHHPEQNDIEFVEYVEAVKLAKKKYENNKEPIPN